MSDVTRSDFVVVANRLPVDRVQTGTGTDWRRSPGGLVTALAPIMQAHHGAWVGWAGAPGEELAPFRTGGMRLVPVPLNQRETELYYEGFANATLWPLYHDVIVPPEYHRDWWIAYERVNQRFAVAAASAAAQAATVWVHDYQLQLVPQLLRSMRPDVRIGFFLHIPFPPAELFSQLPWRREILNGLLGADLVGFQRPGAASNFVRLVRNRLGLRVRNKTIFTADDRTVHASAFPISIDAAEQQRLAESPKTVARAEQIHVDVGNPRHLLLGVDRLDYTKGILQRLRAFGELLADHQIDSTDVVFIQIATPSREHVGHYRTLRDEIELSVGRINGEYGRIGHPVISYQHQSFDRDEMAAMLRAADIAVVTPLRDGMNLVAKEYVACHPDESGALVLSEFAGAADELKQAYRVNPHDINGLKHAMLQAMNDPPRERRRRMRSMRRQLMANDVNVWAANFLQTLDVKPDQPAGADD